jgi:D-serine deaminase-like pyridoxal phosphate-dependent protein
VMLGYPTVDRTGLARLGASPEARAAVTLMVDSTDQLDLLPAAPVRLALDVDAGLRLAGAHLGPKRSPLATPEDVLALACEVVRRGHRLVGVMTYEGQVAGVADDVPGRRARSLAVRRVKSLSVAQLATRRAEIAAALADLVDLELWNAGGSGSLETSAADPAVTEVTAGSGLLVPGLFDHYRSFTPRPAAYVGVPVTRRPAPGLVTVHGGGLVASGAAGRDRLPTPWAPAGLELTTIEGAGEVQTPLTGPAADLMRIGDLVWLRHAKSGEPFEHTTTAWLLSGARIVDGVATYRGHGLAF